MCCEFWAVSCGLCALYVSICICGYIVCLHWKHQAQHNLTMYLRLYRLRLFGWSCSKQRESATLCAVTETCVRDDEGEVVSVVCM